MRKTARRLTLHRETLQTLTAGEQEARLAGGILTATCATGCYACVPAPSLPGPYTRCNCQ